MTAPTLTEAQRRALLWLPEDGSWREWEPGSTSFWDLPEGWVKHRWRLGRHLEFALSAEGIAARARIGGE